MVNPPSTELINVFLSGFSLVLINSALPASDAEKQIAEQTVSGLMCPPVRKKGNENVFLSLIQFFMPAEL